MRRVDATNKIHSTPLGKTKFQGDLPLSPIRSHSLSASSSHSLSLSRDMTADLEANLGLEEQVQKLKSKLGETKTALDKANARCNELESNTWGAKKLLSETESSTARKQSHLEEKIIRLESEVERSNLLLDHEKCRAETMESMKEGLRVKLEEVTQAREEDKEKHSREIAQWNERVNEYEEDLQTKETEYDEELESMDNDHTELQSKQRKLLLRAKALKNEKNELREQCELLETQNDRLTGVEEDLHEELMEANAKIRQLTVSAQHVHDTGGSMEALISDVTELERRRQEVDNLKIEVEALRGWKREHLEIEEKYLAAKNEVSRYELRVEEILAHQEECEEAKRRWEELESALSLSPQNITASGVVARCSGMKERIASLEQANARLEEENGQMKKSLELSSNHGELIQENISLQNKVARLEAEVELLCVSRKETRELFRSLFTEKSLPGAEVERVLASFDSLSQKSEASFQEKMDALLKEKAAVESDLASCQKVMKEMGQRIESLEGRVNMGEFNPATTKALHLSINPSNTANTRELLMKLREIEEPVSSKSSAQVSEKLGDNPQVKSILRRMKTKHDSELDLMKRKFRQKISEFRMAVYWVFGWRFDAESETGPKKRRYRLRSMFSTDGDVLVLEVGETGSLELLDSDFGQRMLNGPSGGVLRESGSIPVFLSQVILDLK